MIGTVDDPRRMLRLQKLSWNNGTKNFLALDVVPEIMWHKKSTIVSLI